MSEPSLPTLGSLPNRLTRLYAGLALYGVGIGLQIESQLGNSPWDVFHQGLSIHLGLSVGTWIIIVGALVMLLWIPLRQKPGLGTLSNVVLLGLFADAVMWLAPTPDALAARWAYLLLGVVATAAATGLYIGAGLGPGPRDGLMTGLNRLGLSIRSARTAIEVTVLAAGWLLGGTVGVGTLVFALAIGPLTQFFMPRTRPGARLRSSPPGSAPKR
ncbi:YitT family protein [Streptosporangium sp. NPDC001681]|uniref:membrane protein YczE n=1 Tax=Streptosporangium sp. NPDC001681 TaxID=3154395 RepID=UPI00332EA491